VQLCDVDELVILDAEWLARMFTSLVARLDASVDDRGLMERDELRAALTTSSDCVSTDRLIALLRHAQLCLPVIGTHYELFPCRLPVGRVDDTVWPPVPDQHVRQVQHAVLMYCSQQLL